VDKDNVVYIHNGVLRKHKLCFFDRKRMELEIVMLSAIRNSHKDTMNCFLLFVEATGNGKKANNQGHEIKRETPREVVREGKGGVGEG
jgi:hypothetical protein